MKFESKFESNFNVKDKVFLAACIIYRADTRTKHYKKAYDYLTENLCNLKPWMGTIAVTKFNDFYREQFKMYLADPLSTHVFDQVFKEYPLIPVTLAICLKINLMSIERDTPLLPNCDFSSDFPNDDALKIAQRVDSLSQECIRSYVEKYYKPSEKHHETLEDLDFRKWLYKYLRHLNFLVNINSGNYAKLDVPELARRLALVIIHESRSHLSYRTVTREELVSLTGPLNFDNWSIEGITRILAPALLRHAVKEYQCLCAAPNPGRNLNHPDLVRHIFLRLSVSDQPIDPTGLDYLLERGAPTHRNEPEGGDAGVDLAETNREAIGELSGDEDIGENHDDMMDFALGDDDALGQPGVAGQTQETPNLQHPKRNTISGAPYARPNAEATDAQGTDSGINSTEPIYPVTSTARKRGRNETETRPRETSSPKRNRHDELAISIAYFQSAMNTELGSLNSEINHINGEMNDMNYNIKGVNDKVKETNNRLENMDIIMKDMNNRINRVDTKIEDVNARIEDMNAGNEITMHILVEMKAYLAQIHRETMDRKNNKEMKDRVGSKWSKTRTILVSLTGALAAYTIRYLDDSAIKTAINVARRRVIAALYGQDEFDEMLKQLDTVLIKNTISWLRVNYGK